MYPKAPTIRELLLFETIQKINIICYAISISYSVIFIVYLSSYETFTAVFSPDGDCPALLFL